MRLAALALVLLDCTSHAGDPSADFVESDVGGIEMAAWDWNQWTLPDKRIVCDVPFCTIDGYQWVLKKHQPERARDLGVTYHRERIIKIRPGLAEEQFHLVMAHEFGHALGLCLDNKHTKTGIMAVNPSTHVWTREVLDRCKEVGACP